jgi:hypothetical protein
LVLLLETLALTAATTVLGTAFFVDVAGGTAFATVVFAIFHDGIGEGNDAQAWFAGAFHGGNGGHRTSPGFFKVEYIITSD